MATVFEWLSAGKDVALAVAGCVTAYVAVSGLSTWNRQLRGAVKFEVARGLAKATYKIRDAIWVIRSPGIGEYEFPENYPNMPSPEQRADGLRHVYSKRWQAIDAALPDFDAQTLEAEALWGGDIREATDKLRSCIGILSATVDTHIDCLIANSSDEEDDRVLETPFLHQIRGRMWAYRGQVGNAFTTQ